MSDPRVPEDRPAKAAAQLLKATSDGAQSLSMASEIAHLRERLAYAEKLSFENGFELAHLMPFKARAVGWEKHADMLKADLATADTVIERLQAQLADATTSLTELEPLSARSQAVADTRARLAYLMRAELVCCDIYEKTAGKWEALDVAAETGKVSAAVHKEAREAFRERLKTAKDDGTYHAICYYGEWAARLCETGELPEGELDYILTRWKGTWSTSPAGGRSPSDGSDA